MNIYARYFDHDILVYSVEELIDFLASIPDINVTAQLESDIRAYVESDISYPKRYKIRPRVYFILIKTTAENMAAFKANRKSDPLSQMDTFERNDALTTPKDFKQGVLLQEQNGWYKGSIVFKRVLKIPNTTKFQYQDTKFTAFVKANSGIECYNRIVEHLKGRNDIDLRSQFPSAKGQNYHFTFCGNLTRENLAAFNLVKEEENINSISETSDN